KQKRRQKKQKTCVQIGKGTEKDPNPDLCHGFVRRWPGACGHPALQPPAAGQSLPAFETRLSPAAGGRRLPPPGAGGSLPGRRGLRAAGGAAAGGSEGRGGALHAAG
ncbi:unnamed protein product, partial [Effrenium voratum]